MKKPLNLKPRHSGTGVMEEGLALLRARREAQNAAHADAWRQANA
jgi:hypothetical protein